MTTRPALAAVTLTMSPGPASSPAVARVCTWPECPHTGLRLTRLLLTLVQCQVRAMTGGQLTCDGCPRCWPPPSRGYGGRLLNFVFSFGCFFCSLYSKHHFLHEVWSKQERFVFVVRHRCLFPVYKLYFITTILNLLSFMPGCRHWILHQTAHLVEYRSLHSPGNPGVCTQLQIEYLPVWRKPLCFLSNVPGLMED